MYELKMNACCEVRSARRQSLVPRSLARRGTLASLQTMESLFAKLHMNNAYDNPYEGNPIEQSNQINQSSPIEQSSQISQTNQSNQNNTDSDTVLTELAEPPAAPAAAVPKPAAATGVSTESKAAQLDLLNSLTVTAELSDLSLSHLESRLSNFLTALGQAVGQTKRTERLQKARSNTTLSLQLFNSHNDGLHHREHRDLREPVVLQKLRRYTFHVRHPFPSFISVPILMFYWLKKY